jgi:TolB-like protein/Tfp pilus assembly protein PilF
MFSDIVGYDSILREDEKKAHDIRKNNKRIHRRLIKKFNGRWLKDMKSGTLASFTSIIDVVMCALSIQKATSELNIPVRIGIHLGEVIFEKKDILGDGVNIASRIHSLSDTKGILVSDTVYKDIKNKEGFEIESFETHTLKGVDSPVGIYKIHSKDESLIDYTIDTGELVRPLSFERKSLVVGILVIAMLAYPLYYFLSESSQSASETGKSVLVLPFNNYLGTDTLDYFVAGMHDALITDIGKVSALNVKSKTTATAVKTTNKSIPEIAEELGINTFIETGVLCIGDSVCLQMKIFDQEENELWIHDFKAERSQILNLYSEITKDIADRINVALTPMEEELLARSRTIDRDVYDSYLRGFSYMEDGSMEAVYKAMENLNGAIEKDPYWAPLYAGLAKVWIVIATAGYESHSVAYQNVYNNLDKAIELDPDLSDAHFIRAMSAYLNEWDWDKSEKEFIKVLAIQPNDATSRIYYSHLLAILQRPDEALTQGKLALDLDPLNLLTQGLYAALIQSFGDCETAMDYYEEILAIDPDHFLAKDNNADAAYQCGDYEKGWKARKHTYNTILGKDEVEKIEGIFNSRGFNAAYEEIVLYLEGLAESGQMDPINMIGPVNMAMNYYYINQDEKAIEWLEKGFEMNHPHMSYVFLRFWDFSRLWNDPRFIDIARKMNLPPPGI